MTLNNDTVVADMPAADVQPAAYRMETGTPGEYYFMENRQNTGTFDAVCQDTDSLFITSERISLRTNSSQTLSMRHIRKVFTRYVPTPE